MRREIRHDEKRQKAKRGFETTKIIGEETRRIERLKRRKEMKN